MPAFSRSLQHGTAKTALFSHARPTTRQKSKKNRFFCPLWGCLRPPMPRKMPDQFPDFNLSTLRNIWSKKGSIWRHSKYKNRSQNLCNFWKILSKNNEWSISSRLWGYQKSQKHRFFGRSLFAEKGHFLGVKNRCPYSPIGPENTHFPKSIGGGGYLPKKRPAVTERRPFFFAFFKKSRKHGKNRFAEKMAFF